LPTYRNWLWANRQMPLIVLDRDGVINEDSDAYIRSLSDWQPIPGSIKAIAALSQAGFTIVVASNQSGLSRGYLGLEDLEAIHDKLCEQVEEEGGQIAGIFYCPHLPQEGCSCRKPATGLLQAIENEVGESPRGAIFIGDSLKDLQAARAYGCQPMLVKTGKGDATASDLEAGELALADYQTIPIYRDLAEATHNILQQLPASKDDR
jgi:D-glycero-D-manno-heptose 1,7-bisphosphate phosphatase